MIRISLVIGLLLACLQSLQAQIPLDQPGYADSVERLIRHAETDSQKARYLLLLSDHWSYTDTARAQEYLDKSRAIAGDNPFIHALSFFYQAGRYFDTDPEKSEVSYLRADSLLQAFDTSDAYYFRAKAWRNYGVHQQLKEDDSTFIAVLLDQAIPLARKAGDSTYQGICYQDLGMLFMNAQQYDKAAKYYLQATEFFTSEAREYSARMTSYIMAARCYVFSGTPRPARPLLEKAYAILKAYPDSPERPAYFLSQGVYYEKLRDWARAESSFDQGIKAARSLGDHYAGMELTFQKYRLLSQQKRYNQAIDVLRNVMQDSAVIKREDNRLLIYNELSQTYAALGNPGQAYTWMKAYTELKDSITNRAFKAKINELEAQYHLSENNQKIANLEAEKARAALRANNNRIFNTMLITVCGVLFILSVFIWIYYKNSKKLSIQKEINYQQQLKALQHRQELTATRAMLQGEENERKRIARDLHDGLGGMLAGVKINLSGWAGRHLKKSAETGFSKVLGQLDSSVSELRRISRNLMPETLLKFGLETALKDLCAFYSTPGKSIDFQAIDLKKNIDVDIQLHIYRIIQELISNAMRHGQASQILVQCSQRKATFYITVEDDGVGFEPASREQAQGMGLPNLQTRIDYLRGRMEIASAPGQGCSINIELNLHGPS